MFYWKGTAVLHVKLMDAATVKSPSLYMAHRSNHLAMGKIEPLAGCQGFKRKSMLILSVSFVVPPPPICTTLIPQLKLSCQQ